MPVDKQSGPFCARYRGGEHPGQDVAQLGRRGSLHPRLLPCLDVCGGGRAPRLPGALQVLVTAMGRAVAGTTVFGDDERFHLCHDRMAVHGRTPRHWGITRSLYLRQEPQRVLSLRREQLGGGGLCPALHLSPRLGLRQLLQHRQRGVSKGRNNRFRLEPFVQPPDQLPARHRQPPGPDRGGWVVADRLKRPTNST